MRKGIRNYRFKEMLTYLHIHFKFFNRWYNFLFLIFRFFKINLFSFNICKECKE